MKKIISLVIILAMALSMVTVCGAQDLSTNLVAHWSFDEIVEKDGVPMVEDLTGRGNDLTINDLNYEVVNGFTGSAINFLTDDNTGGVDKGAYAAAKHMTMKPTVMAPQLNGKEGISVSFWIKRKVIGSSAANAVFNLSPVAAAMKISATRYGFVTETRSMSTTVAQTLSVGRFYPIASNVDYNPQIGTANGPNSHGWIHVTVVNDYLNKKVNLYVDGEPVAADSASTMYWDGGVSNFAPDDTKGIMGVGTSHSILDDVKVYDKALTAQEVKESIPAVVEFDFEEIVDNSVTSKSGVDLTTTGTMTSVKGVSGNTASVTEKATMPAKTMYNSILKAKAVSVSAWVKLEDGVLTTNGGGQQLLQEGKGGLNMVLTSDGSVRVGARSKVGDPYTYVMSESPVFTEGDTSWHHIAGVVDFKNDILTLYVDGALNSTADASVMQSDYYEMTSASDPDYIAYGNTAKVVLDSLKVYRRSLTRDEIVEMASELPFADASFTSTESAVIASCNIANLTGKAISAGNASLILVAYDNETGLMAYANKLDLPALSIGTRLSNQNVAITGIDSPENYTYKLLIWGNLNDLISYQEQIEYLID